jgi:tRNA (guanine26-N2/guanine27-N2)-dimethyltransferase
MQKNQVEEGNVKIVTKIGNDTAFYNPLGKFSRSIFVKIFSAYAISRGGNLTYAEPFSGSGIKGIRLSVEGEGFSTFIFNDIDEGSLRITKENWENNSVKGEGIFYNLDANDFFQSLVNKGRVDGLDVDPFGSSSPYIFNAIRAVKGGGLISFTFTDTQVLGGIHSEALEKRYHIRAKKVQFLKELQARIAITNVILEASIINIAALPVFAHVDKHYVRTYHIIKPKASLSSELIKNIKYITVSDCGYNSLEEALYCPYCGKPTDSIGPLYVGNIFNKDLIKKAHELSKDCKSCAELFEIALEENDNIPFFYDTRYLASILRTATPSKNMLLKMLRLTGFKSSPTVFCPTGIKTCAPFGVLESMFYVKESLAKT